MRWRAASCAVASADVLFAEAIVTEANIAFKLNGGIFDSILLEDVNPENVVSPTEKQFPMSSFLSVIIAGEYAGPFSFAFF